MYFDGNHSPGWSMQREKTWENNASVFVRLHITKDDFINCNSSKQASYARTANLKENPHSFNF